MGRGTQREWVAGFVSLLAILGGCGGDEPSVSGGSTGRAEQPQDSSSGTEQPQDSSSGTHGEAGDESSGGGGQGTEGGPDAARPNWHQDIAPLVAEHCGTCHEPGGIAFAMADYEQTRPWAEVLAIRTEARTMPPWHAVETDECEPPLGFEADPRLSDEQIAMFRTWADLGAPEGDPSDAVALPEVPEMTLSDPTATVAMEGSLTVEADGTSLDFFHCISLDPGNTSDVYIDGLQFMPGNDEIIHHVVMYVDLQGESAGWSDGVQRDCGNGPNVGPATMIGSWLPGQQPTVPPAGVGMRLPAGARIVLNMHYHADVLGPQTDDSSALALRYTEQPPAWVSETRLIGNPGEGVSMTGEFVIPAGEAGHQEVLEYTVPSQFGSVRVWGVLNHMHKVGVDMKVEVERNGRDDLCLVQTPAYDYNFQRYYEYDATIEDAPELRAGDTLRVTCRYDNVIENPGVAEALSELGLDEVQDVYNGDGTLDEMCVAGIGLAVQL